MLTQRLTENREILNELFDLWTKKLPASRTSENVRGPQIHEANLAECMAAVQNPRDLVLIVVSIVANRAVYIHFA